jgi:hypothetical protein
MPKKLHKKTSLLFADPVPFDYLSCCLHQPALDLFLDVSITHDDIFLWVSATAPRWLYSQRAFDTYVRSWDVCGKIRAAKLARTFDTITSHAHTSRPWHDRLALDIILPTH